MQDIQNNIQEYIRREVDSNKKVNLNKVLKLKDDTLVINILVGDLEYIYKRRPLCKNKNIINKEENNLITDLDVKVVKIEYEWDDLTHRHTIMEKVTGKPFYNCMVKSNPQELDIASYNLGKQLGKLHSIESKIVNLEYDIEELKREYAYKVEHDITVLINNDIDLSDELSKAFIEIKDYILSRESNKHFGLTHGDLGSPYNIMEDNGEITLIDLENLGINFQLTDIAHVLVYPDMNKSSKENIIKGYIENSTYTEEEIEKGIGIAILLVCTSYARMFGRESAHYEILKKLHKCGNKNLLNIWR